MQVIEAVLLVLVFFIAVVLTLSSFLSTVDGNLAVIETRYRLLQEALSSSDKVVPQINVGLQCANGEVYFIASGYPAALIKAFDDYYYLVPSPSYVISTHQTNCINSPCSSSCPPSPCCTSGGQELGSVAAFLVLPNGTLLVKP